VPGAEFKDWGGGVSDPGVGPGTVGISPATAETETAQAKAIAITNRFMVSPRVLRCKNFYIGRNRTASGNFLQAIEESY
jgi:hypothetical protein